MPPPPNLSDRQRLFLQRVVEAIELEPINVPGVHDLARILGAPPQAVKEIVRLGVTTGDLVALADDVFFTPTQINALADRLRLAANGNPFTPGQARAILGTTRRYSAPLLDHLDEIGVTARASGQRTFSELAPKSQE